MLDQRLYAFRPDLADVRLQGRVQAECFVEAHTARVAVGRAPLRSRPEHDMPIDSELLYGETVDVFERRDGWAWIKAHLDGYVGYLKEKLLGPDINESTHSVTALRTFVYPEPDLKSPPLHFVPMNALLSATDAEIGEFVNIKGDGWIFRKHITTSDRYDNDHCAVALRFVGTPYLWGGRTSIGLDCSALVQMSLMRCGMNVPRDSDIQEHTFRRNAQCEPNLPDLRRGDIVYWHGHCGIWINEDAFIHANATDMAVTVQPLKQILANIAKASGDDAPRVYRLT